MDLINEAEEIEESWPTPVCWPESLAERRFGVESRAIRAMTGLK